MSTKGLEMFHTQNELVKKAQLNMLMGDLFTARKYARKSYDIANQIFDFSDDKAPYLSGIFVNMALAKYIQYQCDTSEDKNTETVKEAYELTEKALKIKPTNQQALINYADYSIILGDYETATSSIEKLEHNSFNSIFLPQLEGVLNNLLTSLLKMEDKERYKESINLLFSAIEKKLSSDIASSQLLTSQAQINYVLGDVAGAYALLCQALKDDPIGKEYGTTYYLMCQVCNNPQIPDKIEEAIKYGERAIEFLDPNAEAEMKASVLSNYGRAISVAGREEGLEKCLEATNICPYEATYYNYARSLFDFKKFEDALDQAKKALLLCDDEMNLILVADIYRAKNENEKAIEYYEKAIRKMQKNKSLHIVQYQDENGETRWSFTSSKSISFFLKYTFSKIIQCYSHIDVKKASIYLALAEEQYPEEEIFENIKDFLGLLKSSHEEIDSLKHELSVEKEDAIKQRKMSINIVKRLISIQDDSISKDLDSYEDWKEFSQKIDVLINGLEQQAKSNKTLMLNKQETIKSKYPLLKGTPLHFLITAEALYEIHKGTEIDYACIIVEYAKVCEYLLRNNLSRYLTDRDKMLGNIIYIISHCNIQPYNRYLDNLNTINYLRKQSAHTGVLTQKDVEVIQKIYYDKGLLKVLIK